MTELKLTDNAPCDHRFGLVITYSRPWRRFFRYTRHIRCWFCDLNVREP